LPIKQFFADHLSIFFDKNGLTVGQRLFALWSPIHLSKNMFWLIFFQLCNKVALFSLSHVLSACKTWSGVWSLFWSQFWSGVWGHFWNHLYIYITIQIDTKNSWRSSLLSSNIYDPSMVLMNKYWIYCCYLDLEGVLPI
jgi:hypothetical protein